MNGSSMAGLICRWIGEAPSQAERIDDIAQLYTHEDPLLGERFLAEAYFMTFMETLKPGWNIGIANITADDFKVILRRKTATEVFKECARRIVVEHHGTRLVLRVQVEMYFFI